MSVTQDTLEAAYARYVHAAERLSIDTTRWKLHNGVPSAGIAYRSFKGGTDTVGTTFGYLGMYRPEAERSLLMLAHALEDVYEHQNS